MKRVTKRTWGRRFTGLLSAVMALALRPTMALGEVHARGANGGERAA